MRRLVILFVVLSLVNVVSAQENWGWPQGVAGIGGCVFYIANPSFYFADSLILDTQLLGQLDNYQLYKNSLNADDLIQPIEGDSLNLAGYDYFSPFLSYSKERLYFSANLPDGYGGFDIYVSEWDGDGWGEPVNMGAEVNSEYNDLGASLPVDEDEIFLFRNNNDVYEFFDYYSGRIFSCEKIDGQWSEAQEIPAPININDCSVEPCISADGQKLYFCSSRSDTLENILAYVAYRNGGQWDTPILLNENINYFDYRWPWSDHNGSVYSVSCDSSGLSLLFTYYYTDSEGYPNGLVKLSNQTVDIDQDLLLPDNISVSAYPNPFNAQVNINLSLASPADVDISIYDICGRVVGNLNNGVLSAGSHNWVWRPERLATGVYFSNINVNGKSTVKKLVFLK